MKWGGETQHFKVYVNFLRGSFPKYLSCSQVLVSVVSSLSFSHLCGAHLFTPGGLCDVDAFPHLLR